MRTAQRVVAALAAFLLLSGVGLFATAQPTPPLTPAQNLCQDYADNTLTIEVLGDSIAAGYGVEWQYSWQAQLSQQLGRPVWNGAVSGSLVEYYRPGGPYYFHTEFTKAVKPSLVILNFRINDQWLSIGHSQEGYTPEGFRNGYRALLQEIRDASPETQIMLAVSPWVLDTRLDQGPYTQWQYINAVWDLKVEFNAVWLDWMRFMPKYGDNNAAGLMLYDLSHPSRAAQSVLAAQAFERIAAVCPSG